MPAVLVDQREQVLGADTGLGIRQRIPGQRLDDVDLGSEARQDLQKDVEGGGESKPVAAVNRRNGGRFPCV
jgi:hypothetical protein